MNHPLLSINAIDDSPDSYLLSIGHLYARFNTQDSGNISYGVEVNGIRYFVKTAGDPANPQPYLSHLQRVVLLRNAVHLAQNTDHPALCRLYHVIESPQGPLLPVAELLPALDLIFDLHAYLAEKGWVAADFYDGCLLYDFSRQTLRIIDLDTYQQGPFTNTMGRMFGSSRFMAPEEFQLGAVIDQRTTVFTMGRTAAVFLSDGTLGRSPFRGRDALYGVIYQRLAPSPD